MKLKEILNEKYVGKKFVFIDINDGISRKIIKNRKGEYVYFFNNGLIAQLKHIKELMELSVEIIEGSR